MSSVSADFTERELVASRDHPELELVLEELEPRILLNASRIVWTFMQHARDHAGRLAVLSFIRSRALSEATPGAKIGGSHEDGLAVDFQPLDMTPEAFFEAIRRGHVPRASWDKLNLYTGPGTCTFRRST